MSNITNIKISDELGLLGVNGFNHIAHIVARDPQDCNPSVADKRAFLNINTLNHYSNVQQNIFYRIDLSTPDSNKKIISRSMTIALLVSASMILIGIITYIIFTQKFGIEAQIEMAVLSIVLAFVFLLLMHVVIYKINNYEPERMENIERITADKKTELIVNMKSAYYKLLAVNISERNIPSMTAIEEEAQITSIEETAQDLLTISTE